MTHYSPRHPNAPVDAVVHHYFRVYNHFLASASIRELSYLLSALQFTPCQRRISKQMIALYACRLVHFRPPSFRQIARTLAWPAGVSVVWRVSLRGEPQPKIREHKASS